MIKVIIKTAISTLVTSLFIPFLKWLGKVISLSYFRQKFKRKLKRKVEKKVEDYVQADSVESARDSFNKLP